MCEREATSRQLSYIKRMQECFISAKMDHEGIGETKGMFSWQKITAADELSLGIKLYAGFLWCHKPLNVSSLELKYSQIFPS